MAMDSREGPRWGTRLATHEGGAPLHGLRGRPDAGGHCRPGRSCGAATFDNAEGHDPARLPQRS
eukprot:1557761-Alexandrium_andersonii.AAC.1